ncbi:hypothetical protein HF086_001584 [Spodoptera exigua]|uniref:TLC domain-containing protein n=1 Tax=Spodoptera exigua TaxID=7107 RepID=A0A922SJY3_SPOEX|nr:hypothetical protein HF086_001584 [Spodoptera exigua]
METLKWLSELFWDERWWLPRGVKWADVTNGPDKTVLYPDISDFYYFVKALRRANFEKLATALFVGFVPLWFYTRLYLFPQYLYSTSIRSMVFWGPFIAAYVVNSLLFVLFILCVYWTILIVKVVFNTMSSGVPRDVRSSSSEVTDVDDVDKLLLSNSR